ncbi:hypothetical protein ANN_13590 [Periplaneta americana]|uniref:FLYWCH-type domain-containing protein n=1 Tax=Periplaneta americana TaxID=6978 RepID=A0ABQ8TJV2_PERAM|nr:hypothetical protein ANN_13590 [Periplaneta americana]
MLQKLELEVARLFTPSPYSLGCAKRGNRGKLNAALAAILLESRRIIVLGYMYTRLIENRNGVVWRCDMRGGCNATVTLSEGGSSVVKEPSEHKNHSADWGRIKAKECVENMKARAGTSREPTSVIIQNELQRISSEANVNLPKKPSIKKTVRRARKLHLPPEPRNIDELNVIADRYIERLEGGHSPAKKKRSTSTWTDEYHV